MPGLANIFFSDLFAKLDGGIPATLTGITTGTTSGSPIQLGGLSPLGKLMFRFLVGGSGSAAATASMWLATATASAGTYTSISGTLTSIAISLASKYYLDIDTRLQAFCNLGTAPTWVKAIVAIAGAPLPGALDVLGWESGNDPPATYNSPDVIVAIPVGGPFY
jgi:hypothetical protein